MPLFGRLGDLYGHRLLLRIAMVSIAAGSVLVAWGPSFEVLLLLGRVLQGPLAALLPLEIGLVRGRLTAEGTRQSVGMLVGALTCDTGIYSTAKTLRQHLRSRFAAIPTGMTVKGGRFPSETAYETVRWISAGVSLLIAATAAVLTTTAPPHPDAAAPQAAPRR